jgi:DNA primase
MIDQSMINLIDLIPTPLKKVGQTGGGEYHGPCPFCGGKDRFIVQPQKTAQGGRWFCRQCGRHGDALAFVCDYEDLTVSEAMKRLNLLSEKPLKRVAPKEQPVVYAADLDEDKYLCFDPAWQDAADQFVKDCCLRLVGNWYHSAAGKYLEGRGISFRAVKDAMLGVNTTDYRGQWGEASVWLPRGIVIPWSIDGKRWNVRVRRPNPDVEKFGGDKYLSPKGSCGYAMYRIGDVQKDDLIVMTEGEFDALLLRRFLLDGVRMNVSVVSIGSNTGARLKKWTYRLSLAKKVYLCFDNDPAGDNASMWWSQALGRKAVRLRPSRKDITEMYECGELNQFIQEIS